MVGRTRIGSPKILVLQQPPDDVDVDIPVVDVPIEDEIAVVGHGTLPAGVTELCTGLGNGLMPAFPISVDPIGMPTGLVPVRELPGDEADAPGLEDAVVPIAPPAHGLEAPPDMPVLSNREVDPDVPPIAPLLPDIEVEVPELGVVASADVPRPEHVAVVMEPRGDVPAAIGLTPGVASSVAPSGTPVVPTDPPGPIPSGELMPSEGMPVDIPTWAKAGLHNKGHATATIKRGFIEAPCFLEASRFTRRSGRAAP
jgi:hypothetical protein